MFKVDAEKCTGCGKCVKDCFPKDIEIVDKKAVINNVRCISCGHCVAICPENAVASDEYNMEEVIDYDKEKFDISEENLLNFIKYRRTIRQYKEETVEDEKIARIIEAGRFTQTASNLQDVSYIVVKDGMKELKQLTLESLNTLGEKILSNLTPENIFFKRYAEMWVDMYQDSKNNSNARDGLFYNAPTVIVVTATSPVNGALASSNMELMTNTMGLGTMFSGFFVRAANGNQKIMDFLGVKEGKQIITCMAIGYPNVEYSRTVPRKEADIQWK